MRNCSVKTCKNNSSSENIVLFYFPKSYVRNRWIQFTQKDGWTPKKYSTICSEHFCPHLIHGKKLQEGAVPTLEGAMQLAQTVELGKFIV